MKPVGNTIIPFLHREPLPTNKAAELNCLSFGDLRIFTQNLMETSSTP